MSTSLETGEESPSPAAAARCAEPSPRERSGHRWRGEASSPHPVLSGQK